MLEVAAPRVLVPIKIVENLRKVEVIQKIIIILATREIIIKIIKKTKTIKEFKIMGIQVDKMGTEIRMVMDMEVQEE